MNSVKLSHFAKIARVFADILFFVAVAFLDFAVRKLYKQEPRGFFCDDESIKYPFHENTIGIWELIAFILIVPAIIIIIIEAVKQHKTGSNYQLLRRLSNCYKQLGYYFYGFAMIWLATDIAKIGIGRLRPNFFAVCSPQMPDGSTCADPINFGRYITEYTCTGAYAGTSLINEIKRSFPSGHTSLVFYSVVYMCFYFQASLNKNFSKLMKHFMQLVCLMFGLYVALTRIADYWHHWSDVLAGALLGIFFAVFAAVVVADLFKRKADATLVPSKHKNANDCFVFVEAGYLNEKTNSMQGLNKSSQNLLAPPVTENVPFLKKGRENQSLEV